MTHAREDAIHHQVQEQFGATAAAYTTSTGHSDQAALSALVALVEPRSTDKALDIATGAGHTALAFAPHVQEVVAYDLTPAMLQETARNAANRGLSNVITQQGVAETLPFADGTFDIISVRLASHHFADNPKAVREMARVARLGGRIVVVDNYGPEDDELDAQLQHIEKLRDASHVRSYKLSVWRDVLHAAGLRVTRELTDHYSEGRRGMYFEDWVRRAKTPPDRVAELRSIFTNPSPQLRALLKIEREAEDIWFSLPQATITAVR